MKNKKVLGIVSTPYHLIVFMFLKCGILKGATVDLIVTDKTPSMVKAYKKGSFQPYFDRVLFADANKIKNPYKKALQTLFESFVYNPEIKRFLDQPLGTYDDIYFASPGMPDEIVKEIAKTAIQKNKRVNFHRFEDGFASYTKPPVHVVSSSMGRKLYERLWKYDVSQKENKLYLFEPVLCEENISQAGFDLKKIERDDALIEEVICLMGEMLDFTPKKVEENVIFLGQGTANGAGNVETYQKLIYQIADYVGEKNFAIKPHPRGVNDVLEERIHVYQDSCPFELALASKAFEDKTLISYYSTACASGSILFHSKARVIFLYPMAADAFNEKCAYEKYFQTLTSLYDNIYIAKDEKMLQELLDGEYKRK